MISAFLDAIAASAPAVWLRSSRLLYPAVNTLHILGLALLFGAIAAFNAAVLSRFGDAPARRALARLLPRAAALGLGVALITGPLLFSVEPHRYASNPAFQVKLMLVVLGTVHALLARQSRAFRLYAAEGRPSPALFAGATLSLLVWTAAIAFGRAIAFL